MRSALLAILFSGLAHAADGGVTAFAPRSSLHELQDGGVATTVRGCWFDSPTCIDLARERIELRERAEKAEKKQISSPPPDLIIAFGTGTALGVILAVAAVVVLAPYVNPPQPSP